MTTSNSFIDELCVIRAASKFQREAAVAVFKYGDICEPVVSIGGSLFLYRDAISCLLGMIHRPTKKVDRGLGRRLYVLNTQPEFIGDAPLPLVRERNPLFCSLDIIESIREKFKEDCGQENRSEYIHSFIVNLEEEYIRCMYKPIETKGTLLLNELREFDRKTEQEFDDKYPAS